MVEKILMERRQEWVKSTNEAYNTMAKKKKD
jgi:hypothetical protein